jgi:ATP-dependent Clp protease protease subunit
MKIHQIVLLCALGVISAQAKESTDTEKDVSEPVEKASSSDPVSDELSQLESFNKLEAEKLKRETAQMQAEITRLKLERELISERLQLEATKRDKAVKGVIADTEMKVAELTRETELAKLEAEKLAAELKTYQTKASMEMIRLKSEIETKEVQEKRETYADAKPVYLEKPLREDGILVISDRRVDLNGVIRQNTADYVTSRIDFWNNRNDKLPIFIVIDDCPGGSVMAGYRILKAMEASSAPIHVVVKSFAASMAACIATLAEESYAYPNSLILHHQISTSIFFARLNLTEQKEFYEESQRWWKRLATPVAEKMGITTDEFIKKMYARSTSGDWSEFGDKAKELKWVNHIVDGILESSITVHPDAVKKSESQKKALKEQLDEDGEVFTYLPRLNPKDVYFLYNPDGYYRLR